MNEYYQQRREIDYERDAALTAAQFMLSPSVPDDQRKEFEQFSVMYSHIMALGNINRWEIFSMLIAFEEICMLLEIGLYTEARQIMGRELLKMQASRSIEATQLLYGQRGIERREDIQKIYARRQKKGLMSGIASAFGGGKKEEKENWEEVPSR